MKKIKFSIIIPAYNAEKTIKSCVDSVLAQDYDSYEIIIVDDGSKDATARILREEYGDNKKITILSQENKGVSAARNRALKVANGEWIIFLDSDDSIAPTALHSLFSISSDDKCDLIITRLIVDGAQNPDIEGISFDNDKSEIIDRLIFEEGKTRGNKVLNSFHFRCPGGKIIRKSLIDHSRIHFLEGIVNFEDGLFFLTCLMCSRRVLCSNYSFYNYTMPMGHALRTNGIYNNVIKNNALLFKNLVSILDDFGYSSNAINSLALILLIPSLDSALSFVDQRSQRKSIINDLFRRYSPYCAEAPFSSFKFPKRLELFLVKNHLRRALLMLLKAKRLFAHRPASE